MKYFLYSFFGFVLLFSFLVTYADKDLLPEFGEIRTFDTNVNGDFSVILRPGWNVFSTPKILSDIVFSNGGNGISFYKLDNFLWTPVVPNVQNIKPMEGFAVNNTTTGNIIMSLFYKTNVGPTEVLFQKPLNVGRNFLGITSIVDPFLTLGSNVSFLIDFTSNGNINYLNKVNDSFTIERSTRLVPSPQLGEAYGVIVMGSNVVYGGNQNNDSVEDSNFSGLEIGLSNSLPNGTQIPSNGIVKFASINFKAISSNTFLNMVNIIKTGSFDVPLGTKIWFEKDGVRVSSRSTFTAYGEAFISFEPAYSILSGNTETLDLYVELPIGTLSGLDLQFQLSEAISTAQSVSGNFITPVLRTSNYLVNSIKFQADTTSGSTKVPSDSVDFGSFVLSVTGASARDVTFKSIILKQQGTANLANLTGIVLEKSGVVVSNGYSINGQYITIRLNDIISGNVLSVKYTLKGIVNNVENSIDRYQFKLNNLSDLNVIDTLNDFRISLDEVNSNYLMGELSVIEDIPLGVTRVDGLGDTTVSAGADNITLYKIKLSSAWGNGARISNAKFVVVTSGSSFDNNITLTLLVNGTAKESKTFTASGIVSFSNFGSATVNSTTDATIEIVANIGENVTNGHNIRVTLNDLTATDLLTSRTITNYSKPAGALFTVNTPNATISIDKNLVLSKLLLSPSADQKIAAIKLAPTNDKVRLYNVVLNVTGANNANNYRLVNASGTTIASATSIAGNAVSFTNMANTPFVEKDTSESYYLVADMNNNVTTPADLVVGLTSANGRASNGTTVGSAITGIGNSHVAFDRSVIVVKDVNPNKALQTSAMKFKVFAIGGKDVSLNNFGLTLTTAGYTGDLTTKIYKNSVAAANEVTRPTTVDAGTEVTFIVAVPGALVDAASSSQDWNIALNGVEVNGLQVSPYYNIGEFPMTERK